MLVPTLVSAVLTGGVGFLVPQMIAAVPEPAPADAPESADEPVVGGPDTVPAPAKEPYAAIAGLPHLAVRSAVVSAVVGGIVGAITGWAWPLVYLLPMVPLGVALAVIDWRTRRLPTWYLAPAYPVLVLLVLLCAGVTRDWPDLARAGLGWLVMGGFYLLTWLVSPRMMGYGDVRLAGLLGIALGYLGWSQLLVGMYAAFLLFGLPPLLLAVVRRDRRLLRTSMPFGPAMLAGAVVGVALGHPLIAWYLHHNAAA